MSAANNSSYTVSNYILDRLQELGLTHFFAVPGDYASPFLNTLDSYPAITRVPNINELGVGYATDGYGRFKGVAACSVQYGVGTFSILNCFAGGYVERVPMVLIGPSPSAQNREITRTQGVLFHHSTGDLAADQMVMEHATVASVCIDDGAHAPELIDAALCAMLSARRPVYIEVWQNVFSAACAKPQGRLQALSLEGDQNAIQSLLDQLMPRLAQGLLPVLWLGVEIQRFGLQDLMQAIVDKSGLPFTTTSLGKTVLDETQKAFIGTFAGPASPDLTRTVMAESDCVLALGTIITDDYLNIMAQDYGQMVEVSDNEARIGYAHFQQVPLAAFLQALLARIEQDPSFPRSVNLPPMPLQPAKRWDPEQGLTYENFYDELGDWLIAQNNIQGAKLILGESTSLYVFGNLMGMPQDSFVAQAAWGSLGHETGCALGVELATGARPIVVAGDGGFMMICQEISSLVRQKSNALIFVMSNTGYAIEQAFVNLDAFTPQGEYAPFDLLPDWDYLALAQAFGARGARVETVGQLQSFLQGAGCKDGKPTLVQVVIPLKDLPDQLRRLATP